MTIHDIKNYYNYGDGLIKNSHKRKYITCVHMDVVPRLETFRDKAGALQQTAVIIRTKLQKGDGDKCSRAG